MLKEISGEVVTKHRLGHKIGFPTINIEGDAGDLEYGIYACTVEIPEGRFRGAMHYGPRPVFNDENISLEVHILDFTGDLYGQKVRIEVYDRIREVRDFDSMEDLKRQIGEDVEEVRRIVASIIDES